MIELKNLSIGYNELLFTRDYLEIERGNLISLIGPNGSGKTTFLNTLLGISEPLKGEIFISGKPLKEMKRKERILKFGHVSSGFKGVSNLSVYELIAMGRSPYTNILNRLSNKDRDKISSVMEQLELSRIQHKMTTEVSEGERQIALIAKALVQETEMIVLDEPTAHLDYTNRVKVLRILHKIVKNDHKLVIISTHNIELSLEYSDLILAVDAKNKILREYSPSVEKNLLISEVYPMD
ncbi:MAG: ABC transporter ATP-binding protein [Brumimicrobium sp.]|nr:ABC transporter ATP-binding protein [Brumimicrobium sp.]